MFDKSLCVKIIINLKILKHKCIKISNGLLNENYLNNPKTFG